MHTSNKQKTGLIDIAFVSAMKSGSTYLAKICSGHPDIFMTKMEFDENSICIDLKKYKGEKLVAVRRNMKPIDRDAEIYHSHNRDMKFVMLLRNPVDRVFSEFAHHVRKHLMLQTAKYVHPKHMKLKKTVKVHPHSINKNIYDINKDIKHRKNEYITRQVGWIRKSEFHSCLSPYLNLFPRNNFFVTPLEVFSEDPEHWFSKIFTFLDISNIENLHYLNKIVNPGKYKSSFFDRITKRNVPEFIQPTDETKKFLTELFADDVDKMGKLIGLDLLTTWKLNQYL